MIYFVMAMTLYFQDCYLEVQRKLFAGLRWLSMARWLNVGARKSAITMARQRLDLKPLERLFERVVRPIAGSRASSTYDYEQCISVYAK
jgi:hypothetical protein